MAEFSYTLVGDGSSDRRLITVIDWAIAQNAPESTRFIGGFADLGSEPRPRPGLGGRLEVALARFPCDILFVHRDAESSPASVRVREIERAIEGLQCERWVPVVPVRMQEAWLLIDESAIRLAAGNPNGRVPLTLPRPRDLEGVPNPKETLEQLILEASELPRRRRDRVRLGRAKARVAELIQDFTPLRQLAAFQEFEASLRAALDAL